MPTDWVLDHVRDVPDFPEPGIVFKDITPLLADHGAFDRAIGALADPWRDAGITHVAGVEARGFLLAAPIAGRLGAGIIPIRKPGKLPSATVSASYELEYGTDALEIHVDAATDDACVLLVDDVLATGGTARAAVGLVEALGAQLAGISFLLELGFLRGRAHLGERRIESLVVLD